MSETYDLADELIEAEEKMMAKKDLYFESRIVGVSFPNKDGSLRQPEVEKLEKGDKLALVREPKNKYDGNAIKVMTSPRGKQLGYIPREGAEYLAPIMDGGTKTKVKVISKGQAPNGNWGASVKVEWRG